MRFVEAFRKADDVLFQAVRGISELVTRPGTSTSTSRREDDHVGHGGGPHGHGRGLGQNRAVAAAEKAISSPLLEDVSIRGARGVLINITAGASLSLSEVNEAASLIREEASDEANIIFGTVIDDALGDELKVTVVATGFEPNVAEGPGRTRARDQAGQPGGGPAEARVPPQRRPAGLRRGAGGGTPADRQGERDRVAGRVRDTDVPPPAGE